MDTDRPLHEVLDDLEQRVVAATDPELAGPQATAHPGRSRPSTGTCRPLPVALLVADPGSGAHTPKTWACVGFSWASKGRQGSNTDTNGPDASG